MLEQILGSSSNGVSHPAGGGKMSASARARIAKAQRERWAKLKGKTGTKAAPTFKRRKMPASAKAKLAAIARARWAKVKAAGKKKL